MSFYILLLVLILFESCSHSFGQENYFCNVENNQVGFSSSSSYHSAWNSTMNCVLSECNSINSSCRSSSTPCFRYQTISNGSICAPGVLCSLLEICDNITYRCSSNNSICVRNSCCSSSYICLPKILTNFCSSGK